MNCENLRENLYDYLDDSLSPSEKAAAKRHLAACPACSEAVRRELQIAQSLSSRLEYAVASVELDPIAKRGMTTAIERRLAESPEQPGFLFLRRVALPLATAAMILMVAIWMEHHFVGGRNSSLKTAPTPTAAENHEVPFHVSYSVPGYTFRREGNLVIDALTYDTRVVDGAVLAKK